MSEDGGGKQQGAPREGQPPSVPGTPAYPPPPPPPQPGYSQPYGQPAYGAPGYGQQGYTQPPYGQTGQPGQGYMYGYGYGYGPPRTNGLAIASLCCSIAGLILLGFPAVLGLIFGFIARSQIVRSRGMQTGAGLALAGIVIGFAVVALWVALIAAAALMHPECGTPGGRC